MENNVFIDIAMLNADVINGKQCFETVFIDIATVNADRVDQEQCFH